MPISIRVVDSHGFGNFVTQVDIARIQNVLQTIAGQILQWDQRDHGLAIIYPRLMSPFTTHVSQSNLKVSAVGLSSRDSLEPYVYEFGHELGHVISNGSGVGPWAYHGICEGIALIALRIAAEEHFQAIPDDFESYLDRELLGISQLTQGSVIDYLSSRLQSLNNQVYTSSISRNAQRVIAREFYLQYESQPQGLACLGALDRTFPSSLKDFLGDYPLHKPVFSLAH